VARDLGKSDQLAVIIDNPVDDDRCKKTAADLSNAPSFRFVASLAPRRFKRFGGNSGRPVLLCIKRTEMFADDFIGRVALDPPRSGIPGRDQSLGIELKNRIIDDRFEKAPVA